MTICRNQSPVRPQIRPIRITLWLLYGPNHNARPANPLGHPTAQRPPRRRGKYPRQCRNPSCLHYRLYPRPTHPLRQEAPDWLAFLTHGKQGPVYADRWCADHGDYGGGRKCVHSESAYSEPMSRCPACSHNLPVGLHASTPCAHSYCLREASIAAGRIVWQRKYDQQSGYCRGFFVYVHYHCWIQGWYELEPASTYYQAGLI